MKVKGKLMRLQQVTLIRDDGRRQRGGDGVPVRVRGEGAEGRAGRRRRKSRRADAIPQRYSVR